ncbi:hypothetical protein [Brevundimonas sp.]|uniref:hypothetical protein n=1 Tax=Brevundimonas sp. TaxID=1871086 RepID=UPI001DD6F5A8|nr:hypothetical protein [Brevundimonas sp.]MBL0948234.1 hypothetical protein [Brevundimonas sp.]
MSQPSNQAPITNPTGRELVERDTFQNEAIWLPAMAAQHLNAGAFLIEGKTFTDCLIEGPAVLGMAEGVQFEGCNMGVTQDVKALFLVPHGTKAIGVVGVAHCRFVRCRFMMVGFAGNLAAVEEMAQGLTSARAVAEKAQAEAQARAEAEGKAS